MEPKIKFNSSMFGFNKQDVLAYIETLINKGEEERISLEEQVSALNLQLDDKTRLYEALLEKEMELETLLSSSEKENAGENSIDIDSIKEKLAFETARADSLENEVRELKNALSEMKSKNEIMSGQLDEMTDELSEYRRQKQNIGSVLMRAQNEADIMLSGAKAKRDDIILKTESYINDVRKMYEKYSAQILLEQNSVKSSAGNIISEFDNILSYVSNAQKMLDDMASFLVQPNNESKG